VSHTGGTRASPPFWKRWWFWVIVVVVILIAAGVGSSEISDTEAEAMLTVASHECYAATRSLARGDGARARR
jgi:hypothetical protein